MTKQITLEEALKLVEFDHICGRGWQVGSIKGSVHGDVNGVVCGSVAGDVRGSVFGSVRRNVGGDVVGTINGLEWAYIETPAKKLKRLIDEGADKEQLIEAINQLEDNQ